MCSAKHQLPALAGSVVVVEPSPIHLTNEIVGRAIREYRVMARASLATHKIVDSRLKFRGGTSGLSRATDSTLARLPHHWSTDKHSQVQKQRMSSYAVGTASVIPLLPQAGNLKKRRETDHKKGSSGNRTRDLTQIVCAP